MEKKIIIFIAVLMSFSACSGTPKGIVGIAATPTVIPSPISTLPIDSTSDEFLEQNGEVTPTFAIESEIIPQSLNFDLNLSRNLIISNFSDIGFIFQDESENESPMRFIGKSESGTAILDLIGPEDNLVFVQIAVLLPSDDEIIATTNLSYIVGLLNIVDPAWDEGQNWLVDEMIKTADIFPDSYSSYIDFSSRRYLMKFSTLSGILILQIGPSPIS